MTLPPEYHTLWAKEAEKMIKELPVVPITNSASLADVENAECFGGGWCRVLNTTRVRLRLPPTTLEQVEKRKKEILAARKGPGMLMGPNGTTKFHRNS